MRAWKSVGGTATYFLYDGSNPVCELDGSGNVLATNTWGGKLLSRHAGGTSTFYTFDPSGNVAQRLDSSGNVLGTYAFDAFGLRTGTDTTTDPYSSFGGQYGYYADAESGVELLGHRYYDVGTGRFINRDPLGYAGGTNLYAYASNNPVMLADPSGFCPDGGSYSDGLNLDDPNLGLKTGHGFGPDAQNNPDSIANGQSAYQMAGNLNNMVFTAAGGAVLGMAGAAYDAAGAAGGSSVEGGAGNLRVRHYTNSEGLAGIKRDGAINASRPITSDNIVGVQTRYEPYPANAGEVGGHAGFNGTSYVEFNAPENTLQYNNNNTRGIPTYVIPTGGEPLPLNGLNPTYGPAPWWQLWK